jgi:hypothetical protein
MPPKTAFAMNLFSFRFPADLMQRLACPHLPARLGSFRMRSEANATF